MDFSSIPRALQSLQRRQPALDANVLEPVALLLLWWSEAAGTDGTTATAPGTEIESQDLLNALYALLLGPAGIKTTATTTTTKTTTTTRTPQVLQPETSETASSATSTAVFPQPHVRWEPLAVGLFVAEQILSQHAASTTATQKTKTTMTTTTVSTTAPPVYMDGPRVPLTLPAAATTTPIASNDYNDEISIRNSVESSNAAREWNLTEPHIIDLCCVMHSVAMMHLEHSEPRIRTLVAKAVGAYSRMILLLLVGDSGNGNNSIHDYSALWSMPVEMHTRLANSIHEHIVQGRAVLEQQVLASSSVSGSQPTSSHDDDADSRTAHEEEGEGEQTGPPKVSRSSNGALDDTTGWRALETNWQCLASLVSALSGRYLDQFPLALRSNGNEQGGDDTAFPAANTLLDDCLHASSVHVNRHVRAAGMAVLEQWTAAAAAAVLASSDDTQDEAQQGVCYPHAWLLKELRSPLRTTIKAVLKTGLADNWSQVRMAASVLCRAFILSLRKLEVSPGLEAEANIDTATNAASLDADLVPVLLPRMCLNRFYLAQGVKLYSHETWKILFAAPQDDHESKQSLTSTKTTAQSLGLALVAQNLPAMIRYYVQMCDADNHVVREAACQAIAELAVRLGKGGNPDHYERLQVQVPTMLQALLMCFHDESWPVRDEACLATATLCKCYPEECRPELETLWQRWTEQLTDQIWSVREDAAVALGDAILAYGAPMLQRVLDLIGTSRRRGILVAARDQPAMTREQFQQHINDANAHTNSQLYSCGSLAPKLRKGGAGRIGAGCGSCGIDRPKSPWEATDGCIYLIRELCFVCTANRGGDGNSAGYDDIQLSDTILLPMLETLADVCRVRHFPQSDELRSTLWKSLPAMAHALGAQRFKRLYLDLFLDLLMDNLDSQRNSAASSSSSSQISMHAAGQCAEELAALVGPNVLRGRLEQDRHKQLLDRVLQERQLQAALAVPMMKGGDAMMPTGRVAMGTTTMTDVMMPSGSSDGTYKKSSFSPFEPPGFLDHI